MVGATRYRVIQSDKFRDEGIEYGPSAKRNKAYDQLIVQKGSSLSLQKTDGKPNIWLDWYNILLLLFLYTLQGIPIGLSASIPLILSSRVTFQQQALFSLVTVPFSLKLLWAPIVDSLYWHKMGRRKSWIVPTQLLCGFVMIIGSLTLNTWIEDTGKHPSMFALTAYFFFLFLLMATQDIALDGWALTVLQRRNISYASTCNSVGQTIGYYIANVGFLVLYSEEVSNKYFRLESEAQIGGIISLGSFSFFWGVIFIVATMYLWICKEEKHDDSEDEIMGVYDAYKELLHCVKLQHVQSLCLVLLTNRVAVAATDAGTILKFVEFGMPKSFPMLFAPLLVTCGILIPVVVSRLFSFMTPLEVYTQGFKIRLVVAWVYIPLLLLTKRAFENNTLWPGWGFVVSLSCATFFSQIGSTFQFVSSMTFFSRISDPVIGGTYMTLLNTAANLGSKWTTSLSLFLMDAMTISLPLDRICQFLGVECHLKLDGYYLQVLVCTFIGVAWLKYFKQILNNLEEAPLLEWHLHHGNASDHDSENSTDSMKMGKMV